MYVCEYVCVNSVCVCVGGILCVCYGLPGELRRAILWSWFLSPFFSPVSGFWWPNSCCQVGWASKCSCWPCFCGFLALHVRLWMNRVACIKTLILVGVSSRFVGVRLQSISLPPSLLPFHSLSRAKSQVFIQLVEVKKRIQSNQYQITHPENLLCKAKPTLLSMDWLSSCHWLILALDNVNLNSCE